MSCSYLFIYVLFHICLFMSCFFVFAEGSNKSLKSGASVFHTMSHHHAHMSHHHTQADHHTEPEERRVRISYLCIYAFVCFQNFCFEQMASKRVKEGTEKPWVRISFFFLSTFRFEQMAREGGG